MRLEDDGHGEAMKEAGAIWWQLVSADDFSGVAKAVGDGPVDWQVDGIVDSIKLKCYYIRFFKFN